MPGSAHEGIHEPGQLEELGELRGHALDHDRTTRSPGGKDEMGKGIDRPEIGRADVTHVHDERIDECGPTGAGRLQNDLLAFGRRATPEVIGQADPPSLGRRRGSVGDRGCRPSTDEPTRRSSSQR